MHARQGLWRKSDLLLKEIAQVLAREAGLSRECFDGCPAAAPGNAIHRPTHGWVHDGAL
jgi:hypothetical protein